MGKHGATVRGCRRVGRARPHWVKRHGVRRKVCGKKLKRRHGRHRRHRENLMPPTQSTTSLFY